MIILYKINENQLYSLINIMYEMTRSARSAKFFYHLVVLTVVKDTSGFPLKNSEDIIYDTGIHF